MKAGGGKSINSKEVDLKPTADLDDTIEESVVMERENRVTVGRRL